MKNKKLIEVTNLHVYFPLEGDRVVKAVRGIDFHIERGETLALVGESGSGKSVTAMALMRLNENAHGYMPEGEILLRVSDSEEYDIPACSLEQMQDIRGRNISMIFQEPMTSLNPVLQNGFQVMETIQRHQDKSESEARKQAMELFHLVRIPETEKRFNQYPHHLSGGMRQRVMIAMALACRPSLLIADEPTTALDVTIQAQILDLIKALQKEIGMSVLFITHDMGVVAEVADRVAVMLDGKKVEEGTAKNLFKNPKHPYTKALLNAVPRLGSMKGKNKPEKFRNVEVKGTFQEAARASR
ncbi:MAG: ABC transporter ATP-binding protein [Hyphomicrobiaceae bacterium]|nr:ABC transporter ATP-binding protein [Hyphomicrobiaceae bacterium]